MGGASAFDSVRARVVLFGGAAPGAASLADTWVWDGEAWTQLADTGPDARSRHALAFDGGRGRAVLFGGVSTDGTLRGDTWEWDGESWTQVADTGPDARSGHRLAYDSGRSATVLFGGSASGPSLRGDTWAWDGSNWTQEQDVGPAVRQGHGLVFDDSRSQLVLFGGDTGAGVVADTWTWDGTDWTERSRFGPPACAEADMVFDGGSVLLYGGAASLTDKDAAVFAGSWTWDGQHWTQRQEIGPGPRWGHAIAFDNSRGCTVLYGGASVAPADTKLASHLLGDTWEQQGTPRAPAASIATFTVAPTSVVSGQTSVMLTVALHEPAPAEVKVSITADHSGAFAGNIGQPDSISIPPGEWEGQAAWATSFFQPTNVLFFARLGEQKLEATLTVT